MRSSRQIASVAPASKARRFVVLILALAAAWPALAPEQSPAASLGSWRPGAQTNGAGAPVVTGANLTLSGAQFQSEGSQSREKSFDGDLKLAPGQKQAVFTSRPTLAPEEFTDVAPHWWADTPEDTSLQVEIRTSPDGRNWTPWQDFGLEDLTLPQDAITETFASLVSVDQGARTHRYVQSRVTLTSDRAGLSPVLHELTYSFINAGVTPSLPRPQLMMQGTPSDIPKPALVSRADWGSPEGESSPTWTPKFRRVTHIIIHHTATPNDDIDWSARVRAIWYFHSHTRGWGDIGYNYLIDPNGVIYEGRAGGDDVEAGHAYPFNSGTMGIGMIGSFMSTAPTSAAQGALIDLISWKASQRGIDPTATEPISGNTDCGGTVTYVRPTIAGHRDFRGTACGRRFNDTTCPGDRLYAMLPQIRRAVVSDQPALRAVFTNHDTPGNLQPGSINKVHVTVRNAGSLTWPAAGKGAVSIGYRWLLPNGQPIKGSVAEVRTALPRNVAFADGVSVTATLNTPKTAGHYALIWDLYREGQGWFGDEGSRPLRVDVVVGKGAGDKTPPKSSVLPLPIYVNSTELTIRWAGDDDPGGSGIVSYDVQFRVAPAGAWTDMQMATKDTETKFEAQDGYTYEFRSRARDAAGNVEEWRAKADTYTTVDTQPPPIVVETPSDGANVPPGPLLVRGVTEPGAFVAVNDTRAEESAGVFTATLTVQGRDVPIHITAADAAGNVSRLELTVQAAPRYSDVPMSNPDFEAIDYLAAKGIVSGFTDGTFRPGAPMTRAQLAKVLAVARQWGLITPAEPRFSDVSPDNWMYSYVETVAARGAMLGYSDGTFMPAGTISRASTVRAVVLAAGWTPLYGGQPEPAGGNPASWAAPFLQAAWAHGVSWSDDEIDLNLTARANRGEVSVLVYKMMKALDRENAPAGPDDTTP